MLAKKLFLLLMFFSGVASAQDEKRALSILDEMSRRYQAYTSFKINFTYAPAGGRPAKGEAIVKGQKFRLKMADQEIVTDGKTIATYMPETNEVTLQAYDPQEIGDLSPARIYLAYKKGYKNAFTGETNANGQTFENIRLTPTGSSAPISRVELKIGKQDKAIKGWKVFAKGSDTMNFDVTGFQANPDPADADFTFSKKLFPGAEIVDLR